jgi:hypothetical protein
MKKEKVARDIAIAQRWRKQHGYVGRGGVIVIWHGKVQSWVNELRNPEHWQPGCIAIDEHGKIWTAELGNAKEGAYFWVEHDTTTCASSYALCDGA